MTTENAESSGRPWEHVWSDVFGKKVGCVQAKHTNTQTHQTLPPKHRFFNSVVSTPTLQVELLDVLCVRMGVRMKPCVVALAFLVAFCLLAGHTVQTSSQGDDGESGQSFRPGAETRPFQAEVSRLMDIIVHSLYSNKDIFLRELISNAADALDKVRFLALSDQTLQSSIQELPPAIKISVDKENNILSIRDTGIGMSKEELISNLGTIARSGTAAFLEQMQKGGDLNLIGQFGVGFYSVYLVADYVEVVSKSARGDSSSKQWVWESKASGEYAISEDASGNDLERGTQINIHLKPEAKEYLQESKLRELVARYSEFIDFPISLLVEKVVEVEESSDESTEDDSKGSEGSKDDSTLTVEDVEGDDEKEKEPKEKVKKTETVMDWEVLNDAKALWLRPPGNVSDEEYDKFYKVLAKRDWEAPLARSHFKAEGDVDFKAVLYLPSTAPPDMYDNYYTSKPQLKLYVRRVFVSESFEQLLPKWLSFLVGLVDSDSMPLNVSREMLQLSEGIKVIRKKLVRKAIEMIRKLSDADEKVRESGLEVEEEKEKVKNQAKIETAKKYATFWRNFGKAVKMGIIDDTSNRRRLLPLLRFATSATPAGNLTSLDAYVSRMQPNQTSIYYLVGTGGVEELKSSPFVETLVSRGLEVILFTDPLDEYVMGHVNEYEDKSFINVSKDDLKLEEDDQSKETDKKAQKAYAGVAKWWKGVISDPSVSTVKVSRRLSTAPCVVVSGKWGWSATMERIARAQALGDNEKAAFMRGQRTLEINPRHPLVRKLKEDWEASNESSETAPLEDTAKLLYEACLMESGYILDDVKGHTARLVALLGKGLGVTDSSPLPEEEYDADQSEEVGDDNGHDEL